jgi:16S rRNA (uracil1498-N3)-methyltransferase
MTARFYVNLPLAKDASLGLTDAAARHVQVLRMQPGERIVLFNGQGDGRGAGSEGEFEAVIERMGRSDVQVLVGQYTATRREAVRSVQLAIGMPANERMDWLVEKATELGVAGIQPLLSERSVLRLKGERADKKLAHWRGIAIAACEQCGRNRLPVIHEVMTLADWLGSAQSRPPGSAGTAAVQRLLLSLQHNAQPISQALQAKQVTAPVGYITFLSGPEGGLGLSEEAAAIAAGFVPVTLGPRILRAETAPLACLSLLSLATP